MIEKTSAEQIGNASVADSEQREWRSPMAHEISRRLRAGRARAALAAPSLEPVRPSSDESWRPLLDGDLAEQARSTVLDIAEALRGATEPWPWDPCGLALLFGYLALAEPGPAWSSISRDLLDRAVAHTVARASLHGGFVGIAWAVEHLEGRSAGATDDPNESLDALLRKFLRMTPWPGDFDLIAGLAGLGIYGLERARRPIGREILSLVIDRLAEEAEAREGGLTWLSKPALMIPKTRAEHPLGYYNCGVAHGVPAVALVLAGACRAQVNAKRARPMLGGAMHWLLSSRLDATSPSAFPYFVSPDGVRDASARSAWCYGDPGVAAAMLAIARAVGEGTWEREALAVARRASARPMDDCGVMDAGICHGAAGLALLYNRMWQASGDEALRGAAIRWYARTLELRRTGVGVAGYQAYHPEPGCDSRWEDDVTFLTGAAGIALSLLAAISTVEPAWDVLLAASLPSAHRGQRPVENRSPWDARPACRSSRRRLSRRRGAPGASRARAAIARTRIRSQNWLY